MKMILLYDTIDGYYFVRGGKWGIHKDGIILNTPTEAYCAYFKGLIEWSDD